MSICHEIKPYCDVYTIISVGADANIGSYETPLEAAQGMLESRDNEEGRRFEKVHDDTHTITITDITKVC